MGGRPAAACGCGRREKNGHRIRGSTVEEIDVESEEPQSAEQGLRLEMHSNELNRSNGSARLQERAHH